MSKPEPVQPPARSKPARASARVLSFHPRQTAAPTERWDGWLLARLGSRLGPARLRLALGRAEALCGDGPPLATLRFRDRRALAGLLLDPEMAFGEAYRDERVEVEGDLTAVLEAAYRARWGSQTRLGRWLRRSNSLRLSRRNVHRHYDIGNEFYRLWLDDELVYTCAYFPEPTLDLEQAQRSKLEYVCRKLGLRPGERVVEAGCGWGALALHMARQHGVTVRAYNVSSEQVAWARDRARREGLSDRVQFVEDDYRRIDGRADVFVSVGMLEHVGPRSYADLSRVIDRCLDPARGRGLLHFIGRAQPRPLNRWIRRRIFPGAYPPSLAEACAGVLEPAGLSVLDVENLRLHYAKTLEHWRERFEANSHVVAQRFGAPFMRTWRLYLAGSQAAFSTGWLQLYQVCFARAGFNELPWTRARLYGGD